jgi:tripartite-type tricarboxylate transporter receptor subunit TctC
VIHRLLRQLDWRDDMKLLRRHFLHLAAGAVVLPAVPRPASAQSYPTRPVHLIVAVPPGGTFDIVGRLIAQSLSERFGESFVVENRPGAATNIGTDYVVHADADGYTILVCGSPSAINATLYTDLNFVFARDIVPVGGIERAPLIMAVNPALPAKTVPQFISYAKANPGKINMGTGGAGSTGDVAGALFNTMAGLTLTRVPYRGEAPAVTDLIGGQVQVVFVTAGSAVNFVKAGTLRAVAVTSAARMDVLPDVPTIAESVPGYEATSWAGIGAPHGTPAEIVDKLNREINAGLGDAKLKSQLAEFGATAMPGSPADFGKFIAAEIEKWGKVVKAANMKPE